MGASVRVDTVNWPKIIAEIRGSGLMAKAIARKCEIAPTTLSGLYRGATREPCYSVGVKLLKLREQYVTTATRRAPSPNGDIAQDNALP